MRQFLLAVAIGLAVAASVYADDNVRAVQEKLRDAGFYSGEIDGAYSSQLADALTRYQSGNNLSVTGQLDVDTSKALGAKPAVTNNRAAPEQSSETSRHSRRRVEQTLTDAREESSADAEATESNTEMQPRSAPAATARTSSEITEPASAPPATIAGSSGGGDMSTERLRDYVGAFVHAGVDPEVASEADFFANRVKYYDQGVIDREQIRNDLQEYAARWPERHFWFADNITIEPPHRKRVRVTFPLRYELHNGAAYSSGTVNKTLVLEPAGDHLQIVAVSERDTE
jgi:peptidoglycan hydrolase-like protein with peptidoglycan-binding domain